MHASHTYSEAGTFQVTLTAENDFGFSSVTKQVVVEEPETIIFQLAPIIMVPLVPLPTPDFPTNSVAFMTFSGLSSPTHFDTGISTEVHECGIVGMAARHGDIEESGFGNIIYANMIAEGNTWYINANFKTHRSSETWSFFVMCLRKIDSDGFEVYRRVFVEPASNETIDLSYLEIKENRICGVVGFAANSGNINEDGNALSIMKVFTKKNSEGVWELTANFNTHGDHEEEWVVDILCVNDDPSIFRSVRLESITGRTHRDTGMSFSQYACGITGMEILYGDIGENDTGDIIMAVPYLGDNGNWFVFTDFRTHHGEEQWNLDMLCVNRSAAVINSNFALDGEHWPPLFPSQ
jgi:PKD repeat protein